MLSNGSLQDLLLPFLEIRSLLTLSCVDRRYHTLIESRRCFGKPGYFRTVCRGLCCNDRTTMAGLLTGWTAHRAAAETADHSRPPTLLVHQRLDRDSALTSWVYRQRDWLDRDDQEDVLVLESCQLSSWKELCLKLLNRIEAMDKRSLHVVLPPPPPPPHDSNYAGVWGSVRCFWASQTPREPVAVEVLLVGGNCHEVKETFFGICHGNGLLSDSSTWSRGFLGIRGHHAKLSWPARSADEPPVDWSLRGMHYGPAGDEPQEFYAMYARSALSRLCPHILVWTIPLRRLRSRMPTPYRYPNFAMANRVCLRDFILAKECPSRILVVLVTVDDRDRAAEGRGWDTNACRQQTAERLRLDSLTRLGIAWHVSIGHASRRERRRDDDADGRRTLVPILDGFADALRWAWSTLVEQSGHRHRRGEEQESV